MLEASGTLSSVCHKPSFRYYAGIADSVAALFSRTQTRALLGQGRLEIPPIPIRTHPALRALDPRQLTRTQLQELVRLTRAPLDANPVVPGLHGADAAHATVRHAHTVSHRKATAHAQFLASPACRHPRLEWPAGKHCQFRHSLNRNISLDLALVSSSATLGCVR